MARTNFKFSFKEMLKFLSKNKRCPHCGSKELTRYINKEYRGLGKSIIEGMNLSPKIDVYEGVFIYECKDCKRKYTLEGLEKNIEKEINNLILKADNKKQPLLKDNKKHNNQLKPKVRKFFNIVVIVMILILISITVSEHNILVILIFGPIILAYYGIVWFLTR